MPIGYVWPYDAISLLYYNCTLRSQLNSTWLRHHIYWSILYHHNSTQLMTPPTQLYSIITTQLNLTPSTQLYSTITTRLNSIAQLYSTITTQLDSTWLYQHNYTLPSQLDSTWLYQHSYTLPSQLDSTRLYYQNYTLPSQLDSTPLDQHNYTLPSQLDSTQLNSTRPNSTLPIQVYSTMITTQLDSTIRTVLCTITLRLNSTQLNCTNRTFILYGKSKDRLHRLPVWFLWLRRIIKAFKW